MHRSGHLQILNFVLLCFSLQGCKYPSAAVMSRKVELMFLDAGEARSSDICWVVFVKGGFPCFSSCRYGTGTCVR